MEKRFLRLIIEIIDEDGKSVFNPTSNYVRTPLRADVNNVDPTHWYALLMYLGSVITFDLRRAPALSPLYPEKYPAPLYASDNAYSKFREPCGEYETGKLE
ncbi:hypothetical protein [Prevotella falsenii]